MPIKKNQKGWNLFIEELKFELKIVLLQGIPLNLFLNAKSKL